MPHPPGKKAESRQKILDAALALFKARGFDDVTIDEVMGNAGLTRGGFYAHFANKDDLVAHSLMPRTTERPDGPSAEGLRAFSSEYLSAEHRDNPAQGCLASALTQEIARQGPDVRAAFSEFLKYLTETVDGYLGNGNGELSEDALAIVAQMVGTMQLARAVSDPMLSVRILKAGRQAVEYLIPPELAESGDL